MNGTSDLPSLPPSAKPADIRTAAATGRGLDRGSRLAWIIGPGLFWYPGFVAFGGPVRWRHVSVTCSAG